MDHCFLACSLKSNIKTHLKRLQIGLQSVEWIEEDNLHLLLRNLGKLEGTQKKDLIQELDHIDAVPFDLEIEKPFVKKNSLGLLIKPHEKLAALLQEMDKLIKSPHEKPRIDLGVFKKIPDEKLALWLESAGYFTLSPIEIEDFSLISFKNSAKKKFFIEESRYPLSLGGFKI
jgi:2'-5' RNA ligase